MVSCVGDPASIPVKHPSVINASCKLLLIIHLGKFQYTNEFNKSSNSCYIPECCLLLYAHCSHKRLRDLESKFLSIAKREDNRLGSVHPFVWSSGIRLCVCNEWAYAGNCTDAVDCLLILSVGGQFLHGLSLYINWNIAHTQNLSPSIFVN